MRVITLFIVLIVFFHLGHAQILMTDNLDLNPGGEVFDVVYDEINNDFIVAGDFTSIQGVARQNLAIIDAVTMTVSSINPISSINGAIHALEIYQEAPVFPSNGLSRLYLGGNFTTINGVTRNYLCQMRRTEPLFGPFNTNYVVNTAWDSETSNLGNPTDAVHDFAWRGDTLTAAGQFVVLDTPLNYATSDFGGLISFDGTLNSFVYFETFDPFAINNLSSEHYEIDFFGGEFLVAGDQGFDRFDESGNSIASFPNCSSEYPYSFTVHETDVDTLIIARLRYAAGDGITVYELDGTMLNCPFSNLVSVILEDGLSSSDGFPETFNDHVFVAENDQLLSYTRNGITPIQPNAVFPMNNNWFSFVPNGYRSRKMKVAKNKLFLFADNLTTIDGQSHLGFAAMCLPPKDAESFTAAPSQVCEEDMVTYTIPQVAFVAGYRWQYSGTGAQYRIGGSSFPFQPLTDNYVSGTNANSIEIYFPAGTTNGTLTVSPYDTCNTAMDYLESGSQSTSISIVGLPDISMADTLFLNCFNDAGSIMVNSTTPGVTFQIQSSLGTITGNTLYRDTTIAGLIEEYYYGTVIEPILGCTATDSTWLDTNFALPSVPNNDVVLTPTEMNCNVDSLLINIVTPGLNVTWEYDLDPTLPISNPFYIYSDDSLSFTAYFVDAVNGCENSLSIAVPNNQTQAVGTLSGYPTITLPLDTISCNTPVLNLTCGAIDGTASWTSTGTDNLIITVADSAGMTNNTQIFTYETIHNVSGCSQTFNAVIYFDLDAPFVAPYNGSTSINCSDASVELIQTSTGNPIEGWLDAMNTQTNNDTLLVTTPGDYYYQVEGTNGCVTTDTVTVDQNLSINVNLLTDTLTCSGNTVSIQANPVINTGETPTFLWSDGSTTNTGEAIGGTDTELSVIVQTNSGCIGYDTIQILITAPIDAYFSSSAGCSAGAIQVDSVFGGNGGYEYSLDQVNWQTTPAFNGVNFGPIAIYVRDNLGCVYDFQETVSSNATGLAVNFLAPTYTNLGDTAVAISYQSFPGFDSLNWVLPNNAVIAFESDSLVAFAIDTEGWYDVTLIGYSDTCQYSTTQQIFFGASPQFDTLNTSLGVQSILVYPNPTPDRFFTVDVELGTTQNYTIQVVSATGQPIQGLSASGIGQSISETFQFPQGAVPGSYVIHFICDYDVAQEIIILN